MRLAASGELAFALESEEQRWSVWLQPAERRAPAARWLELAPGWRPTELAFAPPSALGMRLALTMAREEEGRSRLAVAWLGGPLPPPSVAALTQAAEGESREPAPGLAHVSGFSFAFAPSGRTVVVADPVGATLTGYSLASERLREVCVLGDDGNPRFPPRVAVAPGGEHIAFTTRNLDAALSEVWLHHHERGLVLLTQIPGSQLHAFPVWSPGGRTLAVHAVHLEQDVTGLILVPHLEGEGVVIYERDRAEPAFAPAWLPAFEGRPSSESMLVVVSGTGRADGILLGLDPRTRELVPLTEPGEVWGEPRAAGAGAVVIDGGDCAYSLRFG